MKAASTLWYAVFFVGELVVIAVSFLPQIPIKETSDRVSLFFAGTLVLVTAFYAWRTHAMAKEMKEARFSSSRPILGFRQPQQALHQSSEYNHKDEVTSAGQMQIQNPTQDPALRIEVHNMGTGPALNIRCYGNDVKGSRLTSEVVLDVLGVGEYVVPVVRFEPAERVADVTKLVAEYADIYGNLFSNWQNVEYDIQEHAFRMGMPVRDKLANPGKHS